MLIQENLAKSFQEIIFLRTSSAFRLLSENSQFSSSLIKKEAFRLIDEIIYENFFSSRSRD